MCMPRTDRLLPSAFVQAAGLLLAVVLTWPALAQVTPPVQPQRPVDTLSLAAANVGVKKCLPAINRLSSLVLNGSSGNDVLVDWDRKSPDSMPFFSLSGVEYRNASLAFSLTAVPGADGSCAIAAERISVAPFTCASIAQQELQGYKVVRLLPTFTVYVDEKDAGASVSLIDSPPGCLLIRRHVDFNWKDPGPAPGPRR
jgi:hypothetical protein